jgi:lipopolysaccharide export system protein LptA
LTGDVKIEEGNDWIHSESANFNFQEGEEGYTAEGNVEIKMILD